MIWSKSALATIVALLVNVSAYGYEATDDPLGGFIQTGFTIPSEPIPSSGFKLKSSQKNLTADQNKLLRLAYSIALEDGHKDPKILQGIILQESNAGDGLKYIRRSHNYYGVAQIKVAATRDVLNIYPELMQEYRLKNSSSREIIKQLTENDSFNLAVASKYLLIMKTYGYSTIRQLALAYNQGPGGAKRKNPNTHHYPNGVVKHIRSLN